MAERRMFAKTIIDSDSFIDMPLSTQALYFHLSMRADDEGFINNPKKIQRMIGCSDDDLKLLIAKNFIIPFESGIVVIKHWKIHNYIRSDRFKQTVYQEERSQLSVKENGTYTLGIPNDSQVAYQLDTQDRLGKDRLGKVSKDKSEDYLAVIRLFNETCHSFPKVKSISDKRKKTLNARLKKYSIEDFKTLFEKAEASDFLKGSNQKDWSATFDWLIKDTNMAKVLDGNYDNRASRSTPAQVTIPMPDYIKDQVEGEAEKKDIFDWLGKY